MGSSLVLVSAVGLNCPVRVVLDKQDKPLTVSPTENNEQNIILWMDHRAVDQTNRINKTNHPGLSGLDSLLAIIDPFLLVLQYVGGVISPEMECPKMLWLKEKKPNSWAKAGKLFDLVDFLTYTATGTIGRILKGCESLCATMNGPTCIDQH